MRLFDRLLQKWRFSVARPWITKGARVLDIGCFQGEFFTYLGDAIHSGMGYDPYAQAISSRNVQLVSKAFSLPSALPDGAFDAVVMLATLEHIQEKNSYVDEIWRVLSVGGRVIVTVPSPFVDRIVDFLRSVRLADGMSIEEHHGFLPSCVPQLFCRCGFQQEHWSCFQLGLNNLFVFQKQARPAKF
jgi:ubiquinone/menaquinone biosynthesis C-methylase UbiE